jgi:hypothetical protein
MNLWRPHELLSKRHRPWEMGKEDLYYDKMDMSISADGFKFSKKMASKITICYSSLLANPQIFAVYSELNNFISIFRIAIQLKL